MKLEFVIRGKQPVGFILTSGPRCHRAYDVNGRSLGFFNDKVKAGDAVYERAKVIGDETRN